MLAPKSLSWFNCAFMTNGPYKMHLAYIADKSLTS